MTFFIGVWFGLSIGIIVMTGLKWLGKDAAKHGVPEIPVHRMPDPTPAPPPKKYCTCEEHRSVRRIDVGAMTHDEVYAALIREKRRK